LNETDDVTRQTIGAIKQEYVGTSNIQEVLSVVESFLLTCENTLGESIQDKGGPTKKHGALEIYIQTLAASMVDLHPISSISNMEKVKA
jgi:hypothetical protein